MTGGEAARASSQLQLYGSTVRINVDEKPQPGASLPAAQQQGYSCLVPPDVQSGA